MNKKTNSGFGITETLISVLLLAVVAAGAISFSLTSKNSSDIGYKKQAVSGVRNNVLALFWDGVAWENTVSDPKNSVFSCLSPDDNGDPQSCLGVTGPLNIIRSASNAVFYDSSKDSMGFYLNGRPCGVIASAEPEELPPEDLPEGRTSNSVAEAEEEPEDEGYGASGAPNQLCPYILQADVSYICEGDCSFPSIKINGQLLPNPNLSAEEQAKLSKVSLQTTLRPNDIECGLGCRTIEYIVGPDGKLSLDSPPAKIVLMIDNSFSMSAAQENLSTGVGNMIETLRGLRTNVNFHIITSSRYYYSMPYEYRYMYGIRSDKDGQPYVGGNCNFYGQESCHQRWDYHLRKRNSDQVFMLKSDFTDSEFTAFKDSLISRVASIGTGGSSHEEGICGATRALFDKGNNKIFTPGDKGGFILISNENDYSNSCMDHISKTRICKPITNTEFAFGRCSGSDCDYHVYSTTIDADKQTFQRRVYSNCTALYSGVNTSNNDGTITQTEYVDVLKTVPGSGTWWPYEAVDSCSYGSAGYRYSCTADERTRATDQCASNSHTLGACYRNRCNSSYVRKCWLTGTDAESGKDLRYESFTRNGVEYANLVDYCQQRNPDSVISTSNSRQGWKKIKSCGTSGYKHTYLPNLVGLKKDNLAGALHKKASAILGPDGYFVSAIIHHPTVNPEGCELKDGESDGKKFKNLVDQRPEIGAIDSICKNDYSSAINFAAQNLLRALASSYVVPDYLNSEIISKGTIIRDGEEIELVFDDTLFLNYKTIQFSEGTLEPGDRVQLQFETKYSESSVYSSGNVSNHKKVRRRQRRRRRSYR